MKSAQEFLPRVSRALYSALLVNPSVWHLSDCPSQCRYCVQGVPKNGTGPVLFLR